MVESVTCRALAVGLLMALTGCAERRQPRRGRFGWAVQCAQCCDGGARRDRSRGSPPAGWGWRV